MIDARFEALTPMWVGSVLGAAVRSVVAEPLAVTGATTDIARLRVTYADDVPRPASFVAKLRGQDEVRAQIDAVMGLFEREARFYKELAAVVPVRTPAVIYLGDGHTTPLLLEDLGELRFGDQAEGLGLSDAEACMDVLAQLHAAYWESPALEAAWLTRPYEGAFAQLIAQLMVSGVSRCSEDLPADPARWEALIARLGDGPHTLVHNDCRLDNVFFDPSGAPVLVDWQVLARTRGSQDVANLLAGSMEPELLSANWRALIDRYHAGLVDRGVTGYSFDEFLGHYRQNVIWPLGQGLALLGALSANDTRGVGPKNVARALAHAGEIEAFAAHEE